MLRNASICLLVHQNSEQLFVFKSDSLLSASRPPPLRTNLLPRHQTPHRPYHLLPKKWKKRKKTRIPGKPFTNTMGRNLGRLLREFILLSAYCTKILILKYVEIEILDMYCVFSL